MKKLILSVVVILTMATSIHAQTHVVQIDNGTGKIGILRGPSLPVGTTFLDWPAAGGTIVTDIGGGVVNLNGVAYTWPLGNAAGVLTNNGAGVLTWSPVVGAGTVTSVSVTSANGFSGLVATATTTPAITLSTTASGVLKGSGGSLITAISGTDYAVGTSALGTGILKSTTGTGALTIAAAADFPTLNQNTSGSAASFTGSLSGDVSGTQGATSVDKIKGNTVPANAAGVLTNNGAGVLTWSPAGGAGTVTSVSVTSANGVSGSVATSTTTPAITLTLGAITPTSVVATGSVTGSNITGTNTGDVTLAGTGTYLSVAGQVITQNPINLGSSNVTGTLGAASFPALTGDVTTTAGSVATTIANGAVSLAKMSNLAANSIIGNNTGASATPVALSIAQVQTMLGLSSASSPTFAGLTISGFAPTAGVVHNSNTGLLSSSLILTADISASQITYAKIQNVAASRLLGNPTGASAAPSEISLIAPLAFSGTSLTVPVMVASGASHASGLVPDPGVTAGTTKFLREDGTWIAPLGGSGISFDVTDGVASNTATLGNDLFNINYTTTGSGSAPGAFINSKSKGGSATATGLTVTADGAANGTVIKGIVINTNSSSAASPTTGLTISSSTSGAANATGLTVSASGGSINPAIVVGTSATADGWVQYASNLITNNAANNSTPADSYSVYKYTGVAATGVTMPGVATAGKTVFVINATAGNMTVNIAGAGTVTINQNRACMFISDGTNWFPTQN